MSKGLKPPKGIVLVGSHQAWTVKERIDYDNNYDNEPRDFIYVGLTRAAYEYLSKSNERFWKKYIDKQHKEFEEEHAKRQAKEERKKELEELERLKKKYEKD